MQNAFLLGHCNLLSIHLLKLFVFFDSPAGVCLRKKKKKLLWINGLIGVSLGIQVMCICVNSAPESTPPDIVIK